MSGFRPHTSPVCFHTAPCCFNLSCAPPGLTRKRITTDLGYTCPKGCVSVNVCVNARMPVGVCALHSLANLTRISSVFFFHQFSDGSPNMSEIKSGQAAPCADVWQPKLRPSRWVLRLWNLHSTRDYAPGHTHTRTSP